jgi:thiamine biosynthesis lipoprotein ApbE
MLRRITVASARRSSPAPLLASCSGAPEPLRDSREALGTIVTITAYGADADAMRDARAVDAAYEAMDAVEAELDAHDPGSAIGRINDAARP